MKRILFLISYTAIFISVKSQTISPIETAEFCPNLDITFSVTIPGSNPSVSSWTNAPDLIQGAYNISSSGGNTTFNFRGRFRDVNISQVFRVNYTNSAGSAVLKDFTFKRIKSLFYNTTCAQVPNQSTITVPRCQIVNIPITVSNVQWGTNFESPTLCFGSITDFEYQLPNGWSIGSTVSNGSNWIPGGNSVTITSDLANGVNGVILVRPRNSCGSGLQNGQTPGQIPISRPAPALSIPETQTDICSGNKTYTLTGLPSGATTTWSITNNYGVASISSATNNSVQVNKINSGNGIETLTATVTHCSFTYTVSKTISFGNPVATFDVYTYVPLNASCYEVDAFYIFRPTLVTGTYPSQYQWSYRVSGTTTETIISSTGEDGLFIFPNTGTYDILVRPVNDCGIGATASVKTIDVVFSCYSGFSMAVTPNPASSDINITIDRESEEVKSLSKNQQVLFQLYELNTRMLVKQWSFDNALNKRQLNISNIKSGNYILVVTKGKFQHSKQIVIRK